MSISSSSTTGFIEPASVMARTIRPGSAPTYVRRWPRISASSRTPPRATRTNLRPRARATDSPSEVLPTPGGPTRASTAPEPRPPTTSRPRWARRARIARYSTIRSLTSIQPVVVGIQHRPSRGDVGRVGGLGAPGQLEDHVEPGADVAGLGALVAAALQLADLAQGGLADVLGQVGFLDPGAVVLGALGLVLAELLADGVELLAEQELALALVHPLADVAAILSFTSISARWSLVQPISRVSRSATSGVSSSCIFCSSVRYGA